MPWLVWVQRNYIPLFTAFSDLWLPGLFLLFFWDFASFPICFISGTLPWPVSHCTTHKLKKRPSPWSSYINCKHKKRGTVVVAFSNIFLLVKLPKHPAQHQWVWAHYIWGPDSFQWCPATGEGAKDTNWGTGSSVWTWGRTSSLWGWRSTGTGCPGRLWSLLLWRYSRPAWTRPCAACCRWPCFGRGVGLDDPQRSLPTPTILWFCVILCTGSLNMTTLSPVTQLEYQNFSQAADANQVMWEGRGSGGPSEKRQRKAEHRVIHVGCRLFSALRCL